MYHYFQIQNKQSQCGLPQAVYCQRSDTQSIYKFYTNHASYNIFICICIPYFHTKYILMVIDVEAMKMPAKKIFIRVISNVPQKYVSEYKQMLANTYEYTQKEIRKSLPSINALIIIIENILLPFLRIKVVKIRFASIINVL